MRLVSFKKGRETVVGVRSDAGLVDLSVAVPGLPRDMIGLLSAGTGAMAKVQSAARKPPAEAVIQGAGIPTHRR